MKVTDFTRMRLRNARFVRVMNLLGYKLFYHGFMLEHDEIIIDSKISPGGRNIWIKTEKDYTRCMPLPPSPEEVEDCNRIANGN